MIAPKIYPYIGITGFMSYFEVSQMFYMLRNIERMLMVGVLVSDKTLNGAKNSHPGRYPLISSIKDIFQERENSNTLKIIHYNTQNTANLYTHLCRLTDLGGNNLDGFQLNITWPKPTELERYHHRVKGKVFILSINSSAMDSVGKSPKKLAKKIENLYNGLVHYILIDQSNSRGITLNTDKILRYLEAIRNLLPKIGIVVTGGLGPDNLSCLTEIIKRFPDVSINAGSKLRSGNRDMLDIISAQRYLKNAHNLF